jgi:hypothetical protein
MIKGLAIWHANVDTATPTNHLQFWFSLKVNDSMSSVNTDEEWMTCYDPNTDYPYYYNKITGITQWESPEEFTSPHSHFFSPPGGIRPQNSTEEIIPSLLKIKSKSGIKLGSFRSNKILPVIEIEPIDQNALPQGENEADLIQDDCRVRKKSRPTVKLKGTPLLNLKRALSSQQLDVDTNEHPSAPSSEVETFNHEYQPLNNVSTIPIEGQSLVAAIASEEPPGNHFHVVKQSVTAASRDYLAMANKYQRFLPYTEHVFDHKTKCLLCSLHTPIDILFPCNHRSVCRNCLSLSQLNPSEAHAATSADAEKPPLSSEKRFCPLCKHLVKKVIPINGKGTEEKEYWDWVFESGKNASPVLDREFLEHFSTNIPSIQEKCSRLTSSESHLVDPEDSSYHPLQDEKSLQREDGSREEGEEEEGGDRRGLEGEDMSQKSVQSESVEPFPQFSLEDNQHGFCCNIQ